MTKKIVRVLLILLLSGIIIFFGALKKVVISGASMDPTLQEGHSYFADRLYYRFFPIRRGDIVLIDHDGMELVKRVYALEGDRIQFVYDVRGKMMHIMNNDFARRLARMVGYNEDTVPPGKIFVLGDNPAVSEDSRMYGSIPVQEVVGLIRRMNFTRGFPLPQGLDAYAQR